MTGGCYIQMTAGLSGHIGSVPAGMVQFDHERRPDEQHDYAGRVIPAFVDAYVAARGPEAWAALAADVRAYREARR